jgi:putative ABC transport system permease protein
MFKKLILHSIKSFKRQRAYMIINILGLSIGIACSLIIALYVIREYSYDRYNEKKARIYRLVLDGKIGGREVTVAVTSAPMGPVMAREFPEVEDFLRMSSWGPTVVQYDDQIFTEDHVMEADSSFFNFFSIPVLQGDIRNLLNAPHKVVLSERTAKKIFGDENPIDKSLKIGTDTVRFVVSGVMADIPENTHFEASMLTSFMTNPRSASTIWLSNSFATYLLLRPNANYSTVDAKLPDLLLKYVGPEVQKLMGIKIEDFEAQGNKYRFYCQKLTDAHLDTSVEQLFKPASDPKYLVIFGTIAILIVVIAAINFMNLSTAQASRRSKEVGIKKISGSSRGMLMTQFLAESSFLALISLILALIITKIALPYLNDLLGSSLSLSLFTAWYTIPVLILFALLVGFISGSYPALFLSSFNPYEVLKGETISSMRTGRLRKILVVFQFAVSILLIIGTMVMYNQIKYMLNKDVGFNKEHLIVINRADALGASVKAFKESVKQIPGVINIASSTAVPNRNNNANGYSMEGRQDETFLIQTDWIDYDFLDTYGMTVLDGRQFDESQSGDNSTCLLNESAIKQYNIDNIEMTRILQPSSDGKFIPLQVIGVVKNFNFESLRNPIQPYIFCMKTDNILWGYLTIRLSGADYSKTIGGIESKWKEFVANTPLQYYFLDDDFNHMYIQERQNASLAVIFSILAIFIAALGLFGLTSFTVEQKTKEIGVRKAMGSSVTGIYFVISREIVILVSISALLAWPIVYYIAGKWLENFYYRTGLSLLTFLFGFLIALGISILTISYRVMKAANVNPAQSLKYE